MIEVQTHLSLNRIDANSFRVVDGMLAVYKGAEQVAAFREWVSAVAKPSISVVDVQAQAA